LLFALHLSIGALVLGGLILGTLSVLTWIRRPSAAVSALSILLSVAAVWVLSAAVEHLAQSLGLKILAAEIQMVSVLALSPAAVCTILGYIGKDRWQKPYLKFTTPVTLLCMALVLTNRLHHLVWPTTNLVYTATQPLLEVSHGPAFWLIILVAHSQLLFAIVLFYPASIKPWRPESTLIYLGFAAPWIANLVHLSGLNPLGHIDLTPYGMIVTGICFAISFQGFGSIFSTVKLADREIIESISDAILVVGSRQQLLSANKRARSILADIPLPAPLDQALAEHPVLLECLHNDAQSEVREVSLTVGGRSIIFDVRSMEVVASDGNGGARVFVLRDTTQQRSTEKELRRHRRQLRQIIDLIPHAIFARSADGKFLISNNSYANIYGMSGSELEGMMVSELSLSEEQKQAIYDTDRAVHDLETPLVYDNSFAPPGDKLRQYQTTKVPFLHDESDAPGIMAMSIDVTEEREQERMLRFLASTDPLTNLPNRRHFRTVLEKALRRAKISGNQAALLSLDLDRFKMINDNYGHPVGDEVLKQVAERLRDNIRFSDKVAAQHGEAEEVTVSRLGGDEFIVLLPSVSKSANAALVARRISKALQVPFEVGADKLQLGSSIGIAIYPQDGDGPETLIRRCDQALTNAKRNLRGSIEFYNVDLSETEERRHALEVALRHALEFDEFRMHYQPIHNTKTSYLHGAEALLRWESETLGVVSTEEFIQVAEESGLVVEIGEVVLRTVCNQIALWREKGLDVPIISVNLSARQLVDLDLQQQVETIFQEFGVSGKDIEFELTEGSMLAEDPRVEQTLAWLQKQGASLALDDFGTGFSSLSHLRRFSLQKLKIDRSFVNGLGSSREDEWLVGGVIALARRLNIKTVAEGVETQEQLDILRDEGCDFVQGYLLGRPVPVQSFEALLTN